MAQNVVALKELNPVVSELPDRDNRLLFLCPKCRQRMIAVEYWGFPASEKPQRWSGHGTIETLTLSPSINSEHSSPSHNGCLGWHGVVKDGECRSA
jgi:hypothetical protein